MEEKDIKITINVGCLEKSRVKKEQCFARPYLAVYQCFAY